MTKLEFLNFIKWQIKMRLYNNDLFVRSFNNHDSDELSKYIYYDDIYKSRILKYLFGSYLITDEQIKEFYCYLDKNYLSKDGTYYDFVIDNKHVKIPVPSNKDKKFFKTELLDLIIPYLIGYPIKKGIPFHEGPYEYNNVKLENGDTVFDLGANSGIFSAYASSKGCNVYAFEPTVETIENYLNKTVELNEGINIINKAVSDSNGMDDFMVDIRDMRCNGISRTNSNILKHEEKHITIPTITLDDFVESNGIKKVDFIKSDIEGAERLMLKGARQVLKWHEPKLAICYYHMFDDYKVLTNLIKDCNPKYEIEANNRKIYAYVNHHK